MASSISAGWTSKSIPAARSSSARRGEADARMIRSTRREVIRRNDCRIARVIPVQTIVPAALAAIVRKAPLTKEKVEFAWRTAVGAAVAAATDVVLDATTLRVRARDRTWQREIERSAATIRTRLDDLLGPGVVRYLDV